MVTLLIGCYSAARPLSDARATCDVCLPGGLRRREVRRGGSAGQQSRKQVYLFHFPQAHAPRQDSSREVEGGDGLLSSDAKPGERPVPPDHGAQTPPFVEHRPRLGQEGTHFVVRRR